MALAHSAVKSCGEDFIFAVVGSRQTAQNLIQGFRRAAASLFSWGLSPCWSSV